MNLKMRCLALVGGKCFSSLARAQAKGGAKVRKAGPV
jgi:hypothetical protein